MTINWQEIITSLGGATIFLSAAAWLIRAIITDRMARDAEKFKNQLQSDTTTEIEKLRHSLQMTALEHQVRFSKLHEKRAEVIAEVHGMLVELNALGERFALDDAFADMPRDQEAFEKVLGAGRKLFYFVQLNRLYLPESVCESVETFANVVTRQARSVQSGASMIGTRVIGGKIIEPSDSDRELRSMMFNKAWRAFDQQIPTARKVLEREFRELLGGKPDRG